MAVARMLLVNLESATLHNWIVTPSPTWQQVEETIRNLNNGTRSSIALFVNDERLLNIGGGSGLYHCELQPDLCRLLNPDVPDDNDEIITLMLGQSTECEKRECVPLDMVLRAARYFCENDALDPSLKWEQYG